MPEEKELRQAQTVYKTFCEMLNEQEWHYEKNDEGLTVTCGAIGEDLEMHIRVEFDVKRQLVVLTSDMPFTVPESRRAVLAVAVSEANSSIVDGSFDYDCLTGKIVFRMTTSFRNCLISKNLLRYILMCSCGTIDHFNDRFLDVTKNDMNFDQVIEFIKK